MRTRLFAALALLALSTAGFAVEQPADEPDEIQVSFEVRVLTVPASAPGLDWVPREGKVAFLSDAELKTAIEWVQGDRRSNVMQTPKVTTFVGQEATVKCVQEESFVTSLETAKINGEAVCVPKSTKVELGTTLTLCGRVAADRRSVSVDVKFHENRVDGEISLLPVTTMVTPIFEGGSQGKPVPFTQFLQAPQFATIDIVKKDVRIASGHAVLAGPVMKREFREEFGTPVLSDLPFVGRLFRTVGYSKVPMRTLLIVSPKIIVAD